MRVIRESALGGRKAARPAHRGARHPTPANASPPWPNEYYRFNKEEYPGEPLAEPGLRVLQAMAAWVRHMKARSRAEQ